MASFDTLPREIRNNIYQMMFQQYTAIIHRDAIGKACRFTRSSEYNGILYTSKKIADEATPYYMAAPCQCIYHIVAFRTFIREVGRGRSYVTRLFISFPTMTAAQVRTIAVQIQGMVGLKSLSLDGGEAAVQMPELVRIFLPRLKELRRGPDRQLEELCEVFQFGALFAARVRAHMIVEKEKALLREVARFKDKEAALLAERKAKTADDSDDGASNGELI